MPQIESYKTVVISGHYGNNVIPINIEFEPDEVIVKTLSAFNGDTGNPNSGMLLLRTDLCKDSILAHIPLNEVTYQVINTPFLLRKPVNDVYFFSLTDITGALPEDIATFDFQLALTLQFIKYKSNFLS